MLRMPAEWEKHEATWMAWPYDEVTFPKKIKKVEKIFTEIVDALSSGERVELLTRDEVDYADVWTRDYAPSFVFDTDTEKMTVVKWNYDAYGRKFPDLMKDNDVFKNLRGRFDLNLIEPGIVLEGGAIEGNGQGKFLTTRQCLLARNVGMSERQYEEYLRKYLGARQVVWLEAGLVNDHTDGHIDAVARFVSEDTVVCAAEDDPKDENFPILRQAEKTLVDAGLRVVKLPMPHYYLENKQRSPASYANFYIGNSAVLVPQYSDPNDAAAVEILHGFFPNRLVIGIDCRDLIYGGGGVHCITREQPVI